MIWSGPAEAGSIVLEVVEARVGLLTLRSEPLGVLRQAVKQALFSALVEAEADVGLRALVLTGTGKAFSVGSDVREFQHDEAWLAEAAAVDQALAEAFEDSRLPVIAAINGHCLGGGLELALACDFRIASTAARLGLPEAHVGAFPAGGGTQRLPRVVGVGRALEMMLTGRIVEAEEALHMGLVESVVEPAELVDVSVAAASQIAALPVSAVAAAKRAVQTGMRHGHAAGLLVERELAVAVGLTEDAAEGQRAFVEKREPRFGDGADWIRADVERRRTPPG